MESWKTIYKVNKKSNKLAKFGVLGCIIAIVVVTILEFPPPIGFETRSQANVSIIWLFLFLAIAITEIVTIPLIFIKPKIGKVLGITAGILNIVQVIADQLHLMQPEVAPFFYSLLEYTVVLFSLMLIYFSLKTVTPKIAL